ncbi:TPA: flagellin, partial [Morganella morganii]
LAEINRVSQQTEFNGIKVLSKDQTLSIQVGANDGQTIDINLGKIDTATLGLEGFSIMDMVAASEVVQGMQVTSATPGAEKYNLTTTDVADLQTALFADADKAGKMFAYSDKDGNTAFLGLDKDGNWTAATAAVKAATPEINDGSGNITPAAPASITFTAVADTAFKADPVAQAAAKSLETLQTMDDALAQVDAMRSGLGASQNRFNSVISNLDNTVINLSESRARILDADFAVEVSNMSRANILQSAGTTVLAQANQVPQNVLTLLR